MNHLWLLPLWLGPQDGPAQTLCSLPWVAQPCLMFPLPPCSYLWCFRAVSCCTGSQGTVQWEWVFVHWGGMTFWDHFSSTEQELISTCASWNWRGHLGLKKSLQAVHVHRQCQATSRPRRAHTECWACTDILSLFTFWKAAPGMSAIWHVAYYSCIAERTLQPANPSLFLHKGSSL